MNSLFNRDIKRQLASVDTDPTEAFKAKLRARILPQPTVERRLPLFRMLVLSGAAIALVLGVKTAFGPANANDALAEAINDTFSFNETGYHHIKVRLESYIPELDSTYSTVSEIWSDGIHAIFDVDARTSPYTGGGAYVSSYFDTQEFLRCDYESQTKSTSCDTPDAQMPLMTNVREGFTTELVIRSITIEPAEDTHGDMYLTWVTDEPLGTTLINLSTGPYAYTTGGWSGTYSWQNEAGEYVNRATLQSNNILQTPFEDEEVTSFFLQIMEIEPDHLYTIGGYEETGQTPYSASAVYLADTSNWTVIPTDEATLQATRDEFNRKFTDLLVSVRMIENTYDTVYGHILDIGNNLGSYTLISSERGAENGRNVEYISYDLGDQGPSMGGKATRVEFARDIDNNLILWTKLYDDTDRLLHHTEVLIVEEAATAPEGLFSVEAWKEHTATLE